MRPGFRDISTGWMFRDDADDLADRIRRLIEWAWPDNTPLTTVELATLKMMMECLIVRELREAGLGVPSL